MANSSGNVEFVFEISEAEAAAQPELDWKALILESVPKLSSADQQELFAMLKHAAPDSLNSTWSTCSTPELQANSTCSTPELQADMVFVAADDNAIVRALSKQHLKSARSHPDSLILGATYKEARTVPSKVMELARKHGHNSRFIRLESRPVCRMQRMRQRDGPPTQGARLPRPYLHPNIKQRRAASGAS